MAEIEKLRWQIVGRGSISPPRSPAVTCGDEDSTTVELILGKGVAGKIMQTSFKTDVTGYMTKQQKEEKGNGE